MAQINVEHKKKSPWPWIIAVIVAIVVIWALFQLFDNDDSEVVVPPPAQSTSMPDPTDPAASIAKYLTRDATDAGLA